MPDASGEADQVTTDGAADGQPRLPGDPDHIAIIMDGNGRWAKKKMLPRKMGHRKGADAVKLAIKGCLQCGVKHLTLFAFSSENWNRPADEVSDLMGLLRDYLKRELDELHERGVALKIIGDRDLLADDINADLAAAEFATKDNENLQLIIALSYGARAEIVRAAKAIAEQVQRGDLDVDSIDDGILCQSMQTAGIPDPDLIIRTSGEQRLSNFLLWQAAYSELLFLDIYWPDFTELDIKSAIEIYRDRDRRFGGRT